MVHDVVWDVDAFSKVLLHSAKYPHCSVNGLLIAKKSDKSSKKIVLLDAIPLFHNFLTLTPMLEVALCQVDSYCQQLGRTIIGYYHASDSVQSQPSPVALKIAAKIHENIGICYLAWMHNDKLVDIYRTNPLVIHAYDDGKWKEVDSARIELSESNLHKASCLLESKSYHSLVDFDNHFDNIHLDWRNQQISLAIAQLH